MKCMMKCLMYHYRGAVTSKEFRHYYRPLLICFLAILKIISICATIGIKSIYILVEVIKILPTFISIMHICVSVIEVFRIYITRTIVFQVMKPNFGEVVFICISFFCRDVTAVLEP